jgi:hypothetical protein
MHVRPQPLSFTYRITAPWLPTSQMSTLLGVKAPPCPLLA